MRLSHGDSSPWRLKSRLLTCPVRCLREEKHPIRPAADTWDQSKPILIVIVGNVKEENTYVSSYMQTFPQLGNVCPAAGVDGNSEQPGGKGFLYMKDLQPLGQRDVALLCETV